ncbi:MAG: hypothetical protein ACQEST_06805 [Bacteroidota bacterium]
MALFGRCIAVFAFLTVILVVLFNVVLFPDVPLSGDILFGTFTALMLAIFYGWIDDMFIRKGQPGLEE